METAACHLPSCFDVFEVGFGDPSIPVLLQSSGGLVFSLEFAESILVDDACVVGSIEERWRDPRLDESDVRKQDAISCSGTHTSRTSQPPRLTPRTLVFP